MIFNTNSFFSAAASLVRRAEKFLIILLKARRHPNNSDAAWSSLEQPSWSWEGRFCSPSVWRKICDDLSERFPISRLSFPSSFSFSRFFASPDLTSCSHQNIFLSIKASQQRAGIVPYITIVMSSKAAQQYPAI